MPDRNRPFTNGNFRVKIGDDSGDSVISGFTEVIMPEFTLDVFDYRNGNEKQNRPRKINAHYEVSNVILKRGLIKEDNLYQWVEQVRNGEQTDSLRDVVVELRDETNETVAVSWQLRDARPVRYTVSDLKGEADGVVLEIVELAFEDFTVEFG
jgi:phage tail-like protein